MNTANLVHIILKLPALVASTSATCGSVLPTTVLTIAPWPLLEAQIRLNILMNLIIIWRLDPEPEYASTAKVSACGAGEMPMSATTVKTMPICWISTINASPDSELTLALHRSVPSRHANDAGTQSTICATTHPMSPTINVSQLAPHICIFQLLEAAATCGKLTMFVMILPMTTVQKHTLTTLVKALIRENIEEKRECVNCAITGAYSAMDL